MEEEEGRIIHGFHQRGRRETTRSRHLRTNERRLRWFVEIRIQMSFEKPFLRGRNDGEFEEKNWR